MGHKLTTALIIFNQFLKDFSQFILIDVLHLFTLPEIRVVDVFQGVLLFKFLHSFILPYSPKNTFILVILRAEYNIVSLKYYRINWFYS